MEKYKHTVHYYETDRMGFTHHSNYIRIKKEYPEFWQALNDLISSD